MLTVLRIEGDRERLLKYAQLINATATSARAHIDRAGRLVADLSKEKPGWNAHVREIGRPFVLCRQSFGQPSKPATRSLLIRAYMPDRSLKPGTAVAVDSYRYPADLLHLLAELSAGLEWTVTSISPDQHDGAGARCAVSVAYKRAHELRIPGQREARISVPGLPRASMTAICHLFPEASDAVAFSTERDARVSAHAPFHRPTVARGLARLCVRFRTDGSECPQVTEKDGAPNRIRTGVTALRGLCPGPLDDGSAAGPAGERAL